MICPHYEVKYIILDSTLVFNECGPESEWPPGWELDDILRRQECAGRYIDSLNKRNNFYIKLEESILKDGFRNPILVNAGVCPDKKIPRLPLEMQNDRSKIFWWNKKNFW